MPTPRQKRWIETFHGSFSKADAQVIAKEIGQDPQLFRELLELWFSPDLLSEKRWWVAYVTDACLEVFPELIEPHWTWMAEHLPQLRSDGEKRQLVRALARYTIPEEALGSIVETAFTWLNDPKQAVAVQVHCMEILARATKRYPELAPELIASLELGYPQGSAGYRSRASKILKRLQAPVK